jgi:hypothetical protein
VCLASACRYVRCTSVWCDSRHGRCAAPRHAHGRARGRIVSRSWSRGSAWRRVPGARSIRARTRCHGRPARERSGLTPASARPTRPRRGPCGGAPSPGCRRRHDTRHGGARRAVARAGRAAVTGVEPERRLSQREAQRDGDTPRTSPSGRVMPLWSQALCGEASATDRSAAGRRHRHGGEAPCSPRAWRWSSRAALDCARAPPVCLRRQTGSHRGLLHRPGGSRIFHLTLAVNVIMINLYLY